MPGTTVRCKKCGSTNLHQITVDTYECRECGAQRRLTKVTQKFTKRRHEIPKDTISISSQYQPLAVYCQNCGERIDRIGSPKDQKRMNNKWANHSCPEGSSKEFMYM